MGSDRHEARTDRHQPQLQSRQLRSLQRPGGWHARSIPAIPWPPKPSGKKILTIEGVGDERNLHPLQRIGHTRVAADCGFCTAGWIVTAKGLARQESAIPPTTTSKPPWPDTSADARLTPAIIRTVMDSAAVLRGEQDAQSNPSPNPSSRSSSPWCGTIPPTAATLPGNALLEGRRQNGHQEVAGLPSRKSQRASASRCPRFPRSPSRASPAKPSTPAASGSQTCCM